MSDVHTTYDMDQRCTAVKESRGKTVSMDCPYTGKGEELSPVNMVEAALGGCMLLAMGGFATRRGLDISDARVDVSISLTSVPVMRFESIDVVVAVPSDLDAADRAALERAADGCPIKHSFANDIPIKVRFDYAVRA